MDSHENRINELKELNKELSDLVKESVIEIKFKEESSADQYLIIKTNKGKYVYGINDLGVWKANEKI